jgi:4-carboxymuconolactone decarboxylase
VTVFEDDPPRLELLSPQDMDDAQRALYDAITGGPRSSQRGTVPITDSDGRLVGPFAVMLLSPEVGDAVQRVGAALRFTTSLTAREREVAILAVAAGARCDFEWLAHSAAARNAGITKPQRDSIRDGRVPEGLSETEYAACRLAQTMTAARKLADADYEAGMSVLGQAKLAELTWLVGYYSALALALAVFRPALPGSFLSLDDSEAGTLTPGED